jgi:signal transduction histidine kinase
MLARLRIRQKLNLLVILPLIAVVLTTVPIVLDRAEATRTAMATARAAQEARELGGLIQDLQRERLLALGHLATGQLDRGALVAQVHAATDDVARLRADTGTRAALTDAGGALATLEDLRPRILARTAEVADVYGVYRDAIGALIDALRLVDRPGVDAAGLARLAALDALIRANEEASSVGAALVAMVADESVAPRLATALASLDQHAKRFRQLGERAQVELVDLVEHGQAGVRLRRLADNPETSNVAPGPARATAALTVAVSYTDLRLIAQDRVIRDIASAARHRAVAAQTAALGVAAGEILLVLLVVGLSAVVGRSIAGPLRRLSHAAVAVADLARAELTRVGDSDETEPAMPAPPRLAEVQVDSADELGELAAAFNQVQATAALMLERQVSSRRNVAIMFANVARRTQSLVGRQLMLIDELERDEQNAALLERLYRLDHVATRLRRSADALLVVSGTFDESDDDMPAPLADVVRSAVAEIEGYRSVRLRTIAPASVVVELVGDLRLLLAELLENAASFSAPGAMVDVEARLNGDCVITIVDHGIGMTPAQLARENRRLIERERLDVAPTTVLGLFVVGRLARRHGLGVRLDPTPGQGVTATVTVPRRLLVVVPGPGSLFPGTGGDRPVGALAAALSQPAAGFGWFSHSAGRRPVLELPSGPVAGGPGPLPAPVEAPSTVDDPPSAPLVPPPLVPPPTLVWPPPPVEDNHNFAGVAARETRAGLTRRTPGQHLPDLVPALRPAQPAKRRDPDAERTALDDFVDGFERARRTQPDPGEPA